MKTRILAIFLVIAMLTLSLVSCGGKKPDVTEDPSVTTNGSEDAASKWKDVNFDGETIIISLSSYEPTFVTDAGATNSIKYIAGVDDYTTDSVLNAVFDRNYELETTLGINAEYQACDLYSNDPDNTLTVIETFVLADLDDSPDVVNTMSYGVVRAGIKGLLYNALSTDKENYFDLSAEGWYSDFMYENTLDDKKIYILAGDYFIDVLRYGYGMLVNLDMYDDLFAAEGGSATLFEMIEDGEWNYDELTRYIERAYVDEGEIGKLEASDTLGAINDPNWLVRSTFATSGLDLFETNADGVLQYVTDTTAIHNYVDDMLNLVTSQGFYLNMANGTLPRVPFMQTFTEGKVLFSFDAPVLSLEGSTIQNMDDKVALLPYPKYNPDTEYGALISDNGNVGCILYSSDKFTECSAYLQMATELSNGGRETLIYEYFDVTLKYKLSNTPEQVTMLEYIRDGLCAPKILLYDNYFAKSVGMKTFGSLINASLIANTNSFASDWQSQITAVQNALDTTLTSFGQN